MRLIVVSAALAALAAPAFAAASWSAVPVQATSKVGFVANSVFWTCDAAGCASESNTNDAGGLDECIGLVQRIGALTSFTGREPMSATRLAQCNAAAAKPRS